jgi:hypothetical protein
VRPDGAELTRLEKVKLLSKWEAAVNNIRVCWEGPFPGKIVALVRNVFKLSYSLLHLELPG